MSRKLLPPYKKGLLRLSVVTATLSAIAGFADPFSGAFVEIGAGYARGSGAGNVNQVVTREDGADLPIGNTFLASKQVDGGASKALGRLSLGYGYMLPHDINLAGVLSYSTDRKLTSTMKLKNVFDVRLQPGYYIAPARTLVYASLGYALASAQDNGSTDLGWTDSNVTRGDGRQFMGGIEPANEPVGNFKKSVGGLVLGLGAKYSPPQAALQNFYVGFDYSYTKYSTKTENGVLTAPQTPNRQRLSKDGIWSQTIKPKTNDFLLTVGYRFF